VSGVCRTRPCDLSVVNRINRVLAYYSARECSALPPMAQQVICPSIGSCFGELATVLTEGRDVMLLERGISLSVWDHVCKELVKTWSLSMYKIRPRNINDR